ncbi:hypothetical protein C8J57DRAFT_1269402, partial [Mycena rebaudengoi]
MDQYARQFRLSPSNRPACHPDRGVVLYKRLPIAFQPSPRICPRFGPPSSVGRPRRAPCIRRPRADRVWKQLGLTTRPGVGGLPCQIVHGTVGTSLGLED